MSVVGIGTDLVDIQRIESSIENLGERFIKRILAPEELERYLLSKRPANFLAKRFAMKEAVAKALGTGFAQGISWHHIIMDHDAFGRPLVSLHAAAKQRCEQLGANHIHVSLSDEAGLVSAFAILSA